MPESAAWDLCEEYFEWRLEEYPEFSTYCGLHDRDDKLNDHSTQAFSRRLVAVEKFLTRITELEAQCRWSEADVLNLQLLKDNLLAFKNGISNNGPNGYYFAVNYMDGIHTGFEELTSWMKFNTEEDFQKYLSRLKLLPNRILADMAMLQEGVSVGCTQSIYSMEFVPEQLNSIASASAEDTVFFAPFKSPSSAVDVVKLSVMKQEALSIIAGDVLPALAKLATYIQQEYMKCCRAREGVDSMPSGAEFYQQCIKWHTSLDLTPDQIHQIGLDEVARIRREMERVMEKTGFTGTIKEFIQKLRSDEEFHFKNESECLEWYRHVCYDIIRPSVLQLFPKIPESKLIIKPALPSRSSGSTGYYNAGTLDGSRPGVFSVNLSNLKDNPKYGVIALSLHEGEPGHHLQGMYAIQSTDMPRFRRFMEDMYYSHAPSKFPIYTAYCEGWGLYSEYLGYELGLYEDAYDEFGFLSFEMFRACRLVADTGLHAKNWTYEEAVNLFIENTALSETDIRNEVRRYITHPAQACAYKLGQLKIKELRNKAEAALGAKFDVRSFHHTILSCGMVPMAALETIIQQYIDRHC